MSAFSIIFLKRIKNQVFDEKYLFASSILLLNIKFDAYKLQLCCPSILGSNDIYNNIACSSKTDGRGTFRKKQRYEFRGKKLK